MVILYLPIILILKHAFIVLQFCGNNIITIPTFQYCTNTIFHKYSNMIIIRLYDKLLLYYSILLFAYYTNFIIYKKCGNLLMLSTIALFNNNNSMEVRICWILFLPLSIESGWSTLHSTLCPWKTSANWCTTNESIYCLASCTFVATSTPWIFPQK